MQLVVGRVGRPHGLRGEVTVEVRTDDPEHRFSEGTMLATDPAEAGPLTVSQSRWHSGRLLVRFGDCADRDQAEQLRGIMLLVDSDTIPPSADPDEFGDHELIGLRAETVSGELVGVVADVLHHGQDLLVIEGAEPRAGREILIPFVAALVPEVDIGGGRIVLDPQAGLLDPEPDADQAG